MLRPRRACMRIQTWYAVVGARDLYEVPSDDLAMVHMSAVVGLLEITART